MVKQIIKMYKAPEKPKVIIFMDKRESLYQALTDFDCEVRQKMLVVADYVLSDRIAVERKTSDDFIASIIDQRIFKQLSALKENFDKPILIIEGNGLSSDRVPANVVRGALASIAIDFAIPILWTKNKQETAGMIYWIAKREQIGEKREIAIRAGKKATTLTAQQEFLVSGLPGISNVRARELLKYFSNPMAIFSAEESELSSVKKLGSKTAKNIKEVLTKKYRGKK
jgi:ERCC4-type nuclease